MRQFIKSALVLIAALFACHKVGAICIGSFGGVIMPPNSLSNSRQTVQQLPNPTVIRQRIASINATIRETEYKLRQTQNDMERRKNRESNAQEKGGDYYLNNASFWLRQNLSDISAIKQYEQQLRQLESLRIQLEALLARAEASQTVQASQMSGGQATTNSNTSASLKRNAKFCTECGAKASPADKFCSQCGNRFAVTQAGNGD